VDESIDDWQVPDSGEESTASTDDTSGPVEPPVELTPVCSRRRGLLLLCCMIVLADTCLYRSTGFSGPAVFLPMAAMILILGIPQRSFRFVTLILLALLGTAAIRLAMNGSSGLLVVSCWILMSLPFCLRGWPPFLLETLVFVAQSIPGGYNFFRSVNQQVRRSELTPIDEGRPGRWLGIGLPVATALVFGTIFLMANPQVLRVVSDFLADLLLSIQRWLRHFSPTEVLFWGTVAWLTAGVLRPVRSFSSQAVQDNFERVPAPSSMYEPFQRTLLTVITLFAGYIVFEFYTLSTNTYEKGFGFSDYAHEGAMWLTVALALATLLLSLIFRGSTFVDPRVSRLRTLAWIWISLNLILAIAVYARLFIYIDYNGMTRMRTIGLLGVAAVVGGFGVMRYKIRWQREFYWLVQRQLWILGLAVFAYVVSPVDTICHRYNVARIMAGDPAPSVQLIVHPVDDEALPTLLPLLDSDQEEIQRGILALMLDRLDRLKQDVESAEWSAWQYSQEATFDVLTEYFETNDNDHDSGERESAISDLKEFAMQWY